MPIRKKGSKYFVDFRKGGQKFQKSCNTIEEAEKIHIECDRRLSQGLPMPTALDETDDMTVELLFDKVARKYWHTSNWGLSQIKTQKRILDIIGKNTLVKEVDYKMIDKVIQHFKDKGLSDSSLNKINSNISKAMGYALDSGYINRKPKQDWLTVDNGRMRYIIYEEEQVMINILESQGKHVYKDFFMFLIDTGLRRGEAIGLKARDCDLQARKISVFDTKNGDPRTVPMTSRVFSILSSLVTKEKRIKNAQVFDINFTQIRFAWEKLKKDMELDNDKEFVLHCLRHTCASRLVQNGVSIQVVKQWLGHRTLQMTLRYAHLNVDNLMNAVNVLENRNNLY
tara:strand:+ start:694 stop:1713 length:1020 start_codon:yes stop_codon:yes gene_type:complete